MALPNVADFMHYREKKRDTIYARVIDLPKAQMKVAFRDNAKVFSCGGTLRSMTKNAPIWPDEEKNLMMHNITMKCTNEEQLDVHAPIVKF